MPLRQLYCIPSHPAASLSRNRTAPWQTALPVLPANKKSSLPDLMICKKTPPKPSPLLCQVFRPIDKLARRLESGEFHRPIGFLPRRTNIPKVEMMTLGQRVVLTNQDSTTQ